MVLEDIAVLNILIVLKVDYKYYSTMWRIFKKFNDIDIIVVINIPLFPLLKKQ